MRLFVALEIPDPVRAELGERLVRVRRELPPARWVPLANVHVTLVFLGEVAGELRPELEAILRPAFASSAPFEARLVAGGCFPPRRPARVAWVGVEAGPVLGELRERVAEATSELCDRADRCPFRPHVTVARPRSPWRSSAIECFERSLAGPIGDRFRVDHGTLFLSHLDRDGARHEPLRRFPLADISEPGPPGSPARGR